MQIVTAVKNRKQTWAVRILTMSADNWRCGTKTYRLVTEAAFMIFAARCYASAAYAFMRYVCVSVCVCLSCPYILSKRIKISSKFFHRRVATPF